MIGLKLENKYFQELTSIKLRREMLGKLQGFRDVLIGLGRTAKDKHADHTPQARADMILNNIKETLNAEVDS